MYDDEMKGAACRRGNDSCCYSSRNTECSGEFQADDKDEVGTEKTLGDFEKSSGADDKAVDTADKAVDPCEDKDPEKDHTALLLKERELKERYLENWRRTQADFDNYRKRSMQERDELKAMITGDILGRLLSVVDNIERALAYANEDEKSAPLHEGIRMVHKQLLQFLETEDVRPIDALGKGFDPRFHEAVMREESEEAENNTVVEEFQRGYVYRDKVLRPSMVKVSQRPN